MLLYNAALTGEALRPAYFDYPPGGSTLGFTDGHTLSVGLHNLQARLMALILLLNGWPAIVGLALVLLPFMLGSRNAWDYFCLVCALLVTGVYVLYPGAGFYEGPRVWLPAVPFLMLLSARGAVLGAGLISAVATRLRAETTGDRQPARWTGAALLAPVLLLLIADGTGGWLFGWNKDWLERNVPQVQNEISDLRDIGGYDNRLVARANEMHLENALILVRPCGQSAVVPPRAIFGCYGTVFIENSVDFNGDVVWAMYATERNERVIGAYPGRDVYIATWDPVSIVPFEPHGPLADEPP
jgi:hypothetical protein